MNMDSIIFVVGSVLILFSLLYYKIRYPYVNQMKLIPGPSGIPFFGVVGLVFFWPRNKRAEKFREMFQQYGPVVRTWLGPVCLIHVGNAEHVQKILSSKVNVEKSLQYSFARPWLGNAIGIIPAEKWSEKRRLLSPAYQAIVRSDYFDIIVRNCEIFVNRLEEKLDRNEFNIFPYVTDLSVDIIAETSLNVKLDVQKGLYTDYSKNIDLFSKLLFKRMLNPLIYLDFVYALTQDCRKITKSIKELHRISTSIINRRIADRRKQNPSFNSIVEEPKDEIHSDGRERKTLLDVLLDMAEQSDNAITLQEIREEVDMLMFAGYDPTNLVIAMAIYLVGLHPEVQDNIHAELDSVLPFEDSPLNVHTMGELKYLQSTMKESIRFYTPVPVIARCLKEPVVLGTHTVPAGTNVVIHMHAIHRSPENYPNPDKFDPSNFFPEREKDLHPFAFIPFSAGPRNCMGHKFTKMEIKVALAMFFKKYEVKSVTSIEDMTVFSELVLRPEKGVMVKLRRRKI